jgi:hypothetical protein
MSGLLPMRVSSGNEASCMPVRGLESAHPGLSICAMTSAFSVRATWASKGSAAFISFAPPAFSGAAP